MITRDLEGGVTSTRIAGRAEEGKKRGTEKGRKRRKENEEEAEEEKVEEGGMHRKKIKR